MTTARPAPPLTDGPPRMPAAIVRLAGVTALALLTLPAQALAVTARDGGTGERTPLDLDGAGTASTPSDVGSQGGSIARVLIGLLVVVAVIYAVTWLLKQLRRGGNAPTGTGITTLTTAPLPGGGGGLHLVRVGNELLLVGSGAQGPTELRRYTEEQAREQGLWPADPVEDDGTGSGGTTGGSGGNALTVLGRTVSWARVAPALSRWGTALVRRLREMTVRG